MSTTSSANTPSKATGSDHTDLDIGDIFKAQKAAFTAATGLSPKLQIYGVSGSGPRLVNTLLGFIFRLPFSRREKGQVLGEVASAVSCKRPCRVIRTPELRLGKTSKQGRGWSLYAFSQVLPHYASDQIGAVYLW